MGNVGNAVGFDKLQRRINLTQDIDELKEIISKEILSHKNDKTKLSINGFYTALHSVIIGVLAIIVLLLLLFEFRKRKN